MFREIYDLKEILVIFGSPLVQSSFDTSKFLKLQGQRAIGEGFVVCMLKMWGWIVQEVYDDLQRTGRSRDRIPVGARFSSPVQTGPEAHSASCTVGTGSFPGAKRPWRGVDHPPPLAPRLKE